ncbi:MAG: GNAT family N-acetyltransferase [Nanoarchaeota archaeon]|nr:GNAT family N-acetyltransferase [Nanoarchaeota archaeon]
MDVKSKKINAKGIKFYVKEGKKEIARAYLYLLTNDLHDQPFGLMEDVFVEESLRGQGIGSKLVEKIIEEAKKKRCYKLICTSRYERPEVHRLYERFGFKDHGKEFRIDF